MTLAPETIWIAMLPTFGLYARLMSTAAVLKVARHTELCVAGEADRGCFGGEPDPLAPHGAPSLFLLVTSNPSRVPEASGYEQPRRVPGRVPGTQDSK